MSIYGPFVGRRRPVVEQEAQLVARHGAPGCAHELFQNLALHGGQPQTFVPEAGVARSGKQAQFSHAKWLGNLEGCGRGAAQDRAETGEQLLGIERCCETVVGAQLEAADAVLFVASGREHEHWYLRFLAELPQYLETVKTRQHHVDNEQVEQLIQRTIQPDQTVLFELDGKFLLTEDLSQHCAKFCIAANNQKTVDPLVRHLYSDARRRRPECKDL